MPSLKPHTAQHEDISSTCSDDTIVDLSRPNVQSHHTSPSEADILSTKPPAHTSIVPEVSPTTITNDVVTAQSQPPEGGYGWICVLSCHLINGFTWGIVASYGVYLSYFLSNSTFPSASPVTYSFVGGSNFAAGLVTAPLVNFLLRRFGTHPVMFTGCVIWLLGWICASFAHTIWELALSMGVLVGLGLGLIWQPSTGIISQWFQRRRSMAQGLTSAGSGVIGVIYSVSTTPMINRLGFPWALRITGLTSFCVLLVATWLIRDRNKVVRPTIRPFDREMLRQYPVWLVLGWSFCNLLGYMVLLYSLGNYGSSIGLSQKQAGVVITMVNLGTAIGRSIVGVVSDRFGRVTTSGLCTLMSGVFCFAWWLNARTYGSLLAYAIINGGIFGIYWATVAPISAEVVELKHLPSLLSLVWLSDVAPTLFSEAIALKLRRPGSGREYLWPQVYAGVCYLAAAGILWELRRWKWGYFVREVNGGGVKRDVKDEERVEEKASGTAEVKT